MQGRGGKSIPQGRGSDHPHHQTLLPLPSDRTHWGCPPAPSQTANHLRAFTQMVPTRAWRPTRGRGSPAGATPALRTRFPPTIGPWPPMKETGSPPPPPPPTELTALRVAHCFRARWQTAGLFPHAKGLSWKPGVHSEPLLQTLSSKFENIAPYNASSKRHFLVPETPIPNLPQSPPQF